MGRGFNNGFVKLTDGDGAEPIEEGGCFAALNKSVTFDRSEAFCDTEAGSSGSFEVPVTKSVTFDRSEAFCDTEAGSSGSFEVPVTKSVTFDRDETFCGN